MPVGKTVRVFAVDVEMDQGEGSWIRWSTVHVTAPDIGVATKKAVRYERSANGMKWRASGVRFVCDAIL